MTSNGRALEILLRRTQNGVPPLALFWLCVVLLVMSLFWVQPTAQVLFCVQFVLAGVLPFCTSWDSRVLHKVRQHRFLDMTILTGLTAQEWSDTLVRRALSALLTMAWKPVLAVVVFMLWLAPGVLPQTLLWVVTLVVLTATLSYCHQLSATLTSSSFGREVRMVLVCGPMAVLAWFELSEWASWVAPRQIQALEWSLGLLWFARLAVRFRLEYVLRGGETARPFLARALRPWSHNLIVMRESWRSARRGGILAVACRRYLMFVLFTAVVAKTVYDVGVGRGPWFIYYNATAHDIVRLLTLYAAAGCLLVYWSTLAAQQYERSQEATILLWTTPLRATEYLNGWIDFATRYRYLEVASMYSVGLIGMGGCWWAAHGWARWAAAREGFQASSIVQVVGMGLVTVVLVRCVACLALRESSSQSTWLAKQLALFSWLVPYLFLSCLLGGLGYLVGSNVGPLVATGLGWAAVLLVTMLFYRTLYREALAHTSSVFGDGEPGSGDLGEERFLALLPGELNPLQRH